MNVAATDLSSDGYLWFDLWRLALGVGAVMLAAMMLRLQWLRARRQANLRASGEWYPIVSPWTTTVSYLILLFLAGIHSYDRMGQHADYYLYIITAAVVLGWFSVIRYMRVDWRLTHNRTTFRKKVGPPE